MATPAERSTIRFLALMLLSLLTLAACQPPPQTTPAPTTGSSTLPVLALVNGVLIDGTGANPVEDAVLLIQGERIVAIGLRDSVTIPSEAQVTDVQGATILPGFFNAHVHGAYDLDRLAAWAQAGVTTVRDLHTSNIPDSFALCAQASQDARYARLVAAGSMITAPDGYPTAIWGLPAIPVNSPEEARQAVNDLLDQGADVIKIAVESGADFGQPGLPMLSPEEMAAIVEAAHQRGTRVSAHVLVSADLEKAVDGGVDDIAHMVTDDLPSGLVDLMVANGLYWVPTLELWKNVGQGRDELAVNNLSSFVAAGGKVALGTDFEGYTTPFQLGMPIAEMELMQEAGMTPMQIIIAGTRNAAYVCNLDQDLGTLEAGKIADVLVVEGSPLDDIHALLNVRWVIHNGALIRSPDSQ